MPHKRMGEWFERWWHEEGSGMPPRDNEDHHEHVKRLCKLAWKNGGYAAWSTTSPRWAQGKSK